MDVNLPRDKNTGKTRGFAFLMYEDQRSTVLAVDNLNGATVRNRTLKVDHVKDYKQPKVKGEDGEFMERDEQSLNAKPELIYGAWSCLQLGSRVYWSVSVDGDGASDSSVSSAPSIDPEDPMRDYLLQQRREEKAKKKGKDKGKSKKSKRVDETPEERRARKERKRATKAGKERAERVGSRDGERRERKRRRDESEERYRVRGSYDDADRPRQ